VLSPIIKNKKNKEENNKGFFYIFNRDFSFIKYKKIKKPLNVCFLKKNKNKKNEIIQKDDKANSLDVNVNKNKISLKEIVNRLYYTQTQKKFGLKEIKKNLKLTEYVALNFAKEKLFLSQMDKILCQNNKI
jgi:hypothetical protein